MTLRALWLLSLLAGAACGSDDHCTHLEGAYHWTNLRDPVEPGDCPVDEQAAQSDTRVEITRPQGGVVRVKQSGVELCPAAVSGCELMRHCQLRASGGALATSDSEWTFTPDGFTGFSTAVVEPGADANTPGCTAHWIDTGTRIIAD